MSLYHLYEYDAELHAKAAMFAERMKTKRAFTTVEKLLADAYLDLLEKRGLPPKMRIGPSIQLISGEYYNYLDPDSTPLSPEDIAHALSKTARCAGHTIGDLPVPVAQHCVLAARCAPQGFKFEALMHDAIEAVTGDVTTPLKQLLGDFKRIEQNCEHALRRQYYLPLELSPEVKTVDLRLACTEKRDVMPVDPPGEGWDSIIGVEPYDIVIEPWTSKMAKERWLAEFNALWPEHELRYLQAQHREAIRAAEAIARDSGVTLHPRIADARKSSVTAVHGQVMLEQQLKTSDNT